MTTKRAWIRIMEIGSNFGCHQIPERSFFIRGYQFPVCSRCAGIVVGEFLSFFPIVSKRFPKKFKHSIFMIAPTAIDGITQYFGLQKSNNKRRFITGIIAGIGIMSGLKFLLNLGSENKNPVQLS